MTLTIFTPDWGETPEHSEGSVCISNTDPSEVAQGCTMILLRDINKTPESLEGVPMHVIRVIMPDLPVTGVVDGHHGDCKVFADVKTRVDSNGVSRQSVAMTGRNGATLEQMNAWFFTLVTNSST